MPKIQLTIRLDGKLQEKLKIISDKEIRSFNNQLEYFLSKGIEEYEKQNGTILLPEDQESK